MSKQKQQTPGEVIARLREEKGWTRYRLAREAGLSPIQVSRLERGVALSLGLRTARRLVKALGASLSVFDAG